MSDSVKDDLSFDPARVSVIVITLNEEANIAQCLESVYGWSDDIYVADSLSEDDTVKIALKYTKNVVVVKESERSHWAKIRNWALSNLNIKHEWVIFVDADELLTEDLKNEITSTIRSDADKDGFCILRRFIFMGKWLKYGGMYGGELRLMRCIKAKYVQNGDAEYVVIDGNTGVLRNHMIHKDLKPFSTWIDKHNKISSMAAKSYINCDQEARPQHSAMSLLWYKVPLALRPVVMFTYCYFMKLGFLDGSLGLLYHLHRNFWYPLLVYSKVKELSSTSGTTSSEARACISKRV